MKLTILGCTGSMSGPESAASSYLISHYGWDEIRKENRWFNLIFDLGPGSFGMLLRHLEANQVKGIDAIFLSHCHADHISDLSSLIIYLQWSPHPVSRPILTYGPADLFSRTLEITKRNTPKSIASILNCKIIFDRTITKIGPLEVEAFEVFHSIESFGYRIQAKVNQNEEHTFGSSKQKKTIVYTGDTDLSPKVSELAKGANILLCDCGAMPESMVKGMHMTPKKAARLANESNPDLVVLTHLPVWTTKTLVETEFKKYYQGNFAIAEQDKVFEL